ncbi:hypothetical protein C8J57DRAFT_1252872 [Mycena rebaudengoi]|nr:hypothetical protein C8J57DRAFT_1252872 [Mycena rebaudengoi]
MDRRPRQSGHFVETDLPKVRLESTQTYLCCASQSKGSLTSAQDEKDRRTTPKLCLRSIRPRTRHAKYGKRGVNPSQWKQEKVWERGVEVVERSENTPPLFNKRAARHWALGGTRGTGVRPNSIAAAGEGHQVEERRKAAAKEAKCQRKGAPPHETIIRKHTAFANPWLNLNQREVETYFLRQHVPALRSGDEDKTGVIQSHVLKLKVSVNIRR